MPDRNEQTAHQRWEQRRREADRTVVQQATARPEFVDAATLQQRLAEARLTADVITGLGIDENRAKKIAGNPAGASLRPNEQTALTKYLFSLEA